MCPDPQILSIYMDGELPSPWKEKMEAHLAACHKCKEKLGNYKHMHDLFIRGASHVPVEQKRIIVERDGSENTSKVSEIELLEKSKEKVWKKLSNKQRYNTKPRYGIWRHKLSVPIPIAIAATLLIVFGITFYMQNNNANSNNQITEFPNVIEEMPYDFLPIAAPNDINSVIQYIADTSEAEIIILQLPESRNFSRTGEPAIIRAADYSRVENASKRRRPQ